MRSELSGAETSFIQVIVKLGKNKTSNTEVAQVILTSIYHLSKILVAMVIISFIIDT